MVTLVALIGLLVWLWVSTNSRRTSTGTPASQAPGATAAASPPQNAVSVQATVDALAATLTAVQRTATPTLTLTPPPAPTHTPTPTATETPTATARPPEAIPHVFPLVPADVATYARAHHDYPATDIFAPEGTAFVAVTDGVVEEMSRDDVWSAANDGLCTRGGRYVSIVGDDRIRYYGSHLSAVESGLEPGARVTAGQVLGYVGSSGNARGIAPHLHFGISRPTGPNDCGVRRGEIWPYEYLDQWKAGINAVPQLPD